MGPLPVAAYCAQKPRFATMARRPLVISFCLYFLYMASSPREKPMGSKNLPPAGTTHRGEQKRQQAAAELLCVWPPDGSCTLSDCGPLCRPP